MANTNSPFGLRFIGLYGSPPTNAALQERRNGILYNSGEAIYSGDLILQSDNGYLYQWNAGTSVDQCFGVFDGCRYLNSAISEITPAKYWPGTGAAQGTVLAQYYPGVLSSTPLFVVQTDSTGITVADIGMNADIAVGSGNTLNGQSGSYLNVSTLSTTNTLPLRIIDLWANYSMGNQPEEAGQGSTLAPGTQAGAYNWAVVALNNGRTTGV